MGRLKVEGSINLLLVPPLGRGKNLLLLLQIMGEI
jgi:hypothetical protein